MAKLYFYYSAMNAGKSTTLLQSAYNYKERGMSTLLFAPLLDDRYGVGKIASRIGLQADAIIFDKQFDFYDYMSRIPSSRGLSAGSMEQSTEFSASHDANQPWIPRTSRGTTVESCGKPACILIDEAQFLTKEQVEQLADIVDQLNIPVLAYGLRSDFRGEPFPGSLALLVWADNLIELKTVCFCGKKAINNARIDSEGRVVKHGEQVLIGANDKYTSMCRKHFREALSASI